ncbi:MAG: phosphoribosylformylglycinamidine cyclo-ligase [Planctomycetota bacterium]
MGLTYRSAGVDRDAADENAAWIFREIPKTFDARVISNPEGFAGLFALKGKGPLLAKRYRDPVLVSGTDGVGTKLKLAFAAGKHDTIGIDLVAMSVNDVLTVGAEPLFFLDYIATGRLPTIPIRDVLSGIIEGCRQAPCALLGGETAQMPGFYPDGEYDLAGFAVGVVERDRALLGKDIRPGDLVLGLSSTGLHSNGFSLARRALLEEAKMRLDATLPEYRKTLGEVLLTPTRIYSKAVHDLLRHYPRRSLLKAMANVTGSGIPGNLVRVLPEGIGVRISRSAWIPPPIFERIQKAGGISDREMFDTFNMGIGYLLVLAPRAADISLDRLRRAGIPSWILGQTVKGERSVAID